ncbi:class I SAM-dependent methyltransferase [Sungkyunkwania multivorans]|uniref:Class I SAM-dependent methyltransferase n=1 Tax=Sungkyunkwania multivorans TaxID=1173618 RepID=A0ABW3CUA0_9FLAO
MKNILDSWNINASEWINTIDKQLIPSRAVTNKVIVNTILKHNPSKLLDVGCGEGWLSRELSSRGIFTVGIDATDELVKNAKTKGNQDYYKLLYEEIIGGTMIPSSPFDAVVFNFSLYEQEKTFQLLAAIKNTLAPKGKIFIQTIHPFFLISQRLSYKSQWIHDSWKGLAGNFVDGHILYARTFCDWIEGVSKIGLSTIEILEPLDPTLGQPLSLVLVLQ